jgi:tetratricopeptide (TPR) repeat protein
MGQRPKISLRRSRHTVSVRPMSPLEYPDRHHLNAAAGWLELGDLVEAGRELSRLSETGGNHPEALTLSWHLLADDGNWTDALEIARQHLRAAPKSPEAWIHQSFALHELQRTNEALAELQRVAGQFPEVGTIPYNLACYSCRLGRLDDARQWLRRAIKVQGKKETLAAAVDDPDLAALRRELADL